MIVDATTRFTKRVENYKKYRPGYPAEIVTFLKERCGLASGATIADVGSGTGLLSRIFIDAGFSVVGVEPNREMREAGDDALAGIALAGIAMFHSVDGKAEATGLSNSSADMVVAGQAFHWFDPPGARAEFVRILKPGGHVALIWNERSASTPFMRDLEAMVDRYAADRDPNGYIRESGRSRIAGFFAPQSFALEEFRHKQVFGYEGLLGRIASSSYLPNSGDADYDPMVRDVQALFEKWQRIGEIEYEYETRVYWGSLRQV